MAIYLLTYDLNHKPEKDYEPVWAFIKGHAAWARLSESSYAIESNSTPEQIFAHVSTLIHQNDQFLVITLRAPWDGRATKEVIDWLSTKLR